MAKSLRGVWPTFREEPTAERERTDDEAPKAFCAILKEHEAGMKKADLRGKHGISEARALSD
jgi:hypothetical protein